MSNKQNERYKSIKYANQIDTKCWEKYYGRLSDDQNQNYTETLSRFEHTYK